MEVLDILRLTSKIPDLPLDNYMTLTFVNLSFLIYIHTSHNC